MHLLLVSGFLGSGKTTLVIQLAQLLVSRQQRVAILVNEIGEIGIDNQMMRQLDLNVWELLNGCICCTLSGDLVSTLHTLAEQYAPHVVLVEPSGAADPRNLLNALPYYQGPPLSSVRTVSIVDPLRLPVLIEVLTPLITSQIQKADLIIIGKSDVASVDELESARQVIKEIHPSAPVLSACLRAPLSNEIATMIMPWMNWY